MSLLNMLTVILFALKLLGKITVSWLGVFAPAIISVIIKVIVFTIALNIKN